MSRRFSYIFSLIILAAVLVFAPSDRAFAEEAEQEAPVVLPSLQDKKITLVQNYKDYVIRFKNIEDNTKFSCGSSNTDVAVVSETGVVSPVNPGTAVISVTIFDKSDEVVTVLDLAVTVLPPYYELTKYSEGCFIGKKITFEVTEYGYDEEVQWSLVGSQYATLTPMTKTSAVLTGIADGLATVKVTSRGKTETIEVRILEGSGELCVVSPKSTPYKDQFTNYSSYNSYTRHYYTLRSYLEHLEDTNGGTLVLKKGVYTITNILCIPSNTRVVLSDGVVISKSYDTGSSYLTSNRSIFHCVSFTDYYKYLGGPTESGLKSYNGAHDIQIIGEGSATIDLNGLNTCAVVICHNKNITIEGIKFLNMNTNHFIEIDAANNVQITNCLFKGFVPSETGRKEAINIDTPDKKTGGFNQDWSSYDCTPVKNLKISDNVFIDLESAIGTHKYTEGKVHSGITITNNLFFNMTAYGIRAMNWDNFTVVNNVFSNQTTFRDTVNDEDYETYAVIINGATNPCVTLNRFENLTYGISTYPWKNYNLGSEYAYIPNIFTDFDIKEFTQNYVSNIECNYVEVYPAFNESKGRYNEKLVEKYDYLPFN